MKNMILTATVGIIFLTAVTSTTQGKSFIVTNSVQNQQEKKPNPADPNPQPAPRKKGGAGKSGSISPVDQSIAVGDSSMMQHKKATTIGKDAKSETEKKEEVPATGTSSPK